MIWYVAYQWHKLYRFVWKMNDWERVNSKCLMMMLRFKSQKLIFTQKLLISYHSIQCLVPKELLTSERNDDFLLCKKPYNLFLWFDYLLLVLKTVSTYLTLIYLITQKKLFEAIGLKPPIICLDSFFSWEFWILTSPVLIWKVFLSSHFELKSVAIFHFYLIRVTLLNRHSKTRDDNKH